MPNNYFSFKQFTVQQDHCAMKVCTDACLLGAWAAEKIAVLPSVKNILDIGTGTGLLSLMIAQKNATTIDAVELEENAAQQAAGNFSVSPWKERLQVFNTAIDQFDPGKKYDVIISNPPFFGDDLKSNNAFKNAAKHDSTLTLDELLQQIKRLLKENGTAYILIPFHRINYLEKLASDNGFFINEKLLVKQSVDHGYFRSLLMLSNQPGAVHTKELAIHDAQKLYSDEFTALLKDYYLKL